MAFREVFHWVKFLKVMGSLALITGLNGFGMYFSFLFHFMALIDKYSILFHKFFQIFHTSYLVQRLADGLFW